jgi:hypothetical protein
MKTDNDLKFSVEVTCFSILNNTGGAIKNGQSRETVLRYLQKIVFRYLVF